MKSWRMTFFLFLLSTQSACEWLLGTRYLVRATDTLGYSNVRSGVAPIRCCASTPKSRSVKCPQCLKNSLFSVCCLSLNFLSSLNILSVSGSISSPSVCLFRKVFKDVQSDWESDYLNLILQVPRTFNVRTVGVRVDVLKPLDEGHNEFL